MHTSLSGTHKTNENTITTVVPILLLLLLCNGNNNSRHKRNHNTDHTTTPIARRRQGVTRRQTQTLSITRIRLAQVITRARRSMMMTTTINAINTATNIDHDKTHNEMLPHSKHHAAEQHSNDTNQSNPHVATTTKKPRLVPMTITTINQE